ncbi:glycosyltransferase (activator-dependent family) [Streptomyces sp. CZ24]|uniref:nucleotide disphospho-sugar-binding domain-containing protein n=1 Tax=Streptomyces TaxID=1883 RepID=UPI0004C72D6C|nr:MULTISPECIES: nucleotide disphospho-sugar-binding domain-containing protein [Streptomyces]MBL0777119.1 DUF1205 domain-containing protein [Streptomyces albidoflavus]MBL0800804.1 DUF1205 domain-containing protein [Streptomyces albidoflavus]MBV1957399.1 DUF1205 domain-containing protein [Streptomyces sp. BV333]MCG5123009.1 DUF1205 domain-containing protein [Streptomyces sp. T7(2022)]MCK2145399.1 DUF1205 domain-containing protein [Streptomyces sp. WAC00276]
MRVLFVTVPLASHVYPSVSLAHALQSAGHEVRLASKPGVEDLITGCGLHAVTVGMPADEDHLHEGQVPIDALALDPQDEESWRSVRRYLTPRIISANFRAEDGRGRGGVIDDLVTYCRSWQPDLVLWDPAFPAAAIAARASGAEHGRLLWALDTVGHIRHRTRQELGEDAAPEQDPLVAAMLPALERYGVDFGEDLLLGRWSLDPVPAGGQLPAPGHTYHPMRIVPYTGSAVEPEWLRTPPTRPRVCLTYGASVRGYAPRFATVPLPVLMEAFAGMDIEVVATLNDEEIAEAGTIPDNVRTVDYLPFTQLLPTCSAIVYQGGDGTFGCAAPQSLPQLINLSPKWGELAVAQYVESRGAGLVVEREGATAESVRGQLHRILTEPAFRKGAEELCREITAMPTPHAIVPLLEELAKKPADATA